MAGAEAEARAELDRMKRANAELAEWVALAVRRLKPRPKLAVAVAVAYVAGEAGWPGVAVKLLEGVRQNAKREPLVLYAHATALMGLRMFKPALGAARELAGLAPESAQAQVLIGRILQAQKRSRQAAEAYAKAAERLGKTDLAGWNQLGKLLAQVGAVDPAIAALQRVLALDPQHAHARNNLAWIYVTHKPDKLGEARRLAARAVEQQPRNPSFRDTHAWALFHARQYEAAEREVRKALELGHRKPVYLYHLGLIAFAQEKHEESREALAEAVRRDPDFPEADTARATLEILERKLQKKKPKP
jgi:tetratricopeptide (TPR) repeat protein